MQPPPLLVKTASLAAASFTSLFRHDQAPHQPRHRQPVLLVR